MSGGGTEDRLDLDVRWGDLTGIRRESASFDSGGCWALRRERESLFFDVYSPLFGATPIHSLRLDGDGRRGEVVLERTHHESSPSVDPLGFPLAELLLNQRLARAGGVEFHGCGIRTPEGRGLLFVGHSGDGKTTTAKLWDGRPGVTILSDDRIIVRSDLTPRPGLQRDSRPHPVSVPSPPLSVRTERGRGRGEADGRADSAPGTTDRTYRIYGTPWHGEGRFAANADAPLSAIFILQRGETTRAVPVAGADAISLLFARAFPPFYDAGAVDAVLETIDGIAASIPCYRFSFVPDGTAIEAALLAVGEGP